MFLLFFKTLINMFFGSFTFFQLFNFIQYVIFGPVAIYAILWTLTFLKPYLAVLVLKAYPRTVVCGIYFQLSYLCYIFARKVVVDKMIKFWSTKWGSKAFALAPATIRYINKTNISIEANTYSRTWNSSRRRTLEFTYSNK